MSRLRHPAWSTECATGREACCLSARRCIEANNRQRQTGSSRGLFDITRECAEFVAGEGDGLLSVFVPHATAGVVIMELGAGSDVDLMSMLDTLLPRDDRWRHRHGSPGHGADHVLPLLVPPSITIPVVDGELRLGTWQSIALLDPNVDNSVRRVELSFISG